MDVTLGEATKFLDNCDAPTLVRTLIMHTMRTTKIRDSLIDTTTQQKTQIESYNLILQARGLEGSNTKLDINKSQWKQIYLSTDIS